MTKLLKNYEWFQTELAMHGLIDYVVNNHEEAEKSRHKHNIIFIPDEPSGFFDIYLTGKENGLFGEYVCWVSDELVEDPELLYVIHQYVIEGCRAENVGDKLREMNPLIEFTPIER